MRNYFFYTLILILVLSCHISKPLVGSHLTGIEKEKSLDSSILKSWHRKDIQLDSIPGISIERAYRELIKKKRVKEIIVAVIDTQMDIAHQESKDLIWINDDEIPNNGLDDDTNGYIDDVTGWNFIGNSKGETLRYVGFDYTRIVKAYMKRSNTHKLQDLQADSILSPKIKRALKAYNKKKNQIANDKKQYKQTDR